MDKFIGIVSGHRPRFYIRDESKYSFFCNVPGLPLSGANSTRFEADNNARSPEVRHSICKKEFSLFPFRKTVQ